MKKFFLFGIIAVILVAVPLTVYLLTSQKTTTQSGAAPSTLLSFTIPSNPAVVGTPIAIPIVVDPTSGGGATPNQVSFIKMVITYDGSKLQAAGNNYFVADPKLSPPLEGPTNTCNGNVCTISATLSTGADPSNTISAQTTVATLNFNPLAATDASNPTKLTFASGSQALSIASSDKPAENVLAISRLQPGALTITASSGTTATPTSPPTDTTTPTPTGSGGGGSTPVSCSALTADNATGTTVPFTVLFTATGGSTTATITKVSFNYGDGTVQDITSGTGIGTNSISIQSSHIYKTTGTFTATAVLTDSAGNTTTPSSCSQTITIGGSTTTTPTTAPTAVASAPTATPTIPATGPGNVFVGVGIVGAIITIVGLVAAVGI